MTHEERVLRHEYSLEGIHEHAERLAAYEEIMNRMLRDYMCCADFLAAIDPDTPARRGMTILERIDGTIDGMRIRRYIDELTELGVVE